MAGRIVWAMERTPANDAHLVQLVRGALGRCRPRINVSSCSLVVTLHGTVSSLQERDEIGALVRTVPGVSGVINRLRVTAL